MGTYPLQDQFIQSSINVYLLDLEYYVNLNLTLSTLIYITLSNFLDGLSALLSNTFSSQ